MSTDTLVLGHPLLSDAHQSHTHFSFASLARWLLKFLMWVLLLYWILLFFLVPSDFGANLYTYLVSSTSTTLFGETGSALLLYNAPIFIIACLAVPYLALSKIVTDHQHQNHFHRNQTPSFRLWTFPVLIDGPLGIVSAAELICIILFVLFLLWSAYSYTVTNLELLPDFGHLTPKETRVELLQMSSFCLGLIALSCLAFLFIPVARGSILLSLIKIPFEHAIRYHVWIGNLTMFLLTLHGLGYVIVWTSRGILLSSLVEWKSDTGANLAGVIAYIFCFSIWVTSFHPLRRLCFEVFFYTHQLYILFVIFFALHVGDTIFSKAAGGLFLFMLDRFLRFCQSKRDVDVISGTIFPCGTVKLVISKPRKLQYNALSFIFLRVGEISWLQWHPFSLLDGECHLSILVKPTGSWTCRLKEMVSNAAESDEGIPFPSHYRITASVEGPYGHHSPYHLRYRNLILVAGGGGISPFFAIVRDICHLNLIEKGKPCSPTPRNILIVWALKRSDELSLLSEFDAVFPLFSDELNVEIQAFVTHETEQPQGDEVENTSNSFVLRSPNVHTMSILVGTGNKIWSGIYIFVSSVGFIICLGLLEACYIEPLDISSWWYRGVLLVACMAAGVLVFGGLVIGLWHYWGRISACREEMMDENYDKLVAKELVGKTRENFSTIKYGCRPDFKEILELKSECWGHIDTCVIVCGPQTLQSSVARECRTQNLTRMRRNGTIFHFHSHSFSF